MFSFLLANLLTQATPAPQEIFQPQEVRPLPGQLDQVPVFNSNSPELVQSEGVLLSTFPPTGKTHPEAHLDFLFQGRFDLFAHHIARAKPPEDLRTLYLGVLVYNPSDRPVTIDTLPAASYLSQPDAPFIDLLPVVDNPVGAVYAGPGSRATAEVLRGRRQPDLPAQLEVPPKQSRMLLNLPIPVRTLTPPLNGRSTAMRLRSNGPVYLASLALFAKPTPEGGERPPSLEEWQTVLETGKLAEMRDKVPTPLDQTKGAVIYGRVAGVALGSEWRANITDNPQTLYLTTPQPGQAFSYGISTLYRGRLGTGQNQSAEMVRRYPDTAYQAHGNYAIQYSLSLPLKNVTTQPQKVVLTFQTPIKEDQNRGGLRFLETLPKSTFFRGTVRFRYNDDAGLPQTRYVHLVQRRGQQGEPLVTLNIQPNDIRLVEFDLLYPPDSTPPQVLTIKTLN